MKKMWNRGTALVLAAVLCASALGGCSKKAQAKPVYTFNGEAVDADLTHFLLRYQQAEIDESYGNMFTNSYGQNFWTLDMTGSGLPYEYSYKDEFGRMMERLLLAEEHAADYGVELSEEDKAAIAKAAEQFLADNDEEALKSMHASQEIVERALTLYTVQSRAQDAMCADVDTNVSDEEAAQRRVSYIEYTPVTEEQTEETESLEQTEAEVFEVLTEAEGMTEGETSPVETEEADKTGSSDETEEAQETEAAGSDQEESETEDPALSAAKAKYEAMAQEQLEKILSGEEEFDQAADAVRSSDTAGVSASSYTFGKDDDYPAAEIIEATNDLADETVVDHLVESDGSWYILRVDAAFDEEATQDKKDDIVEDRRQDRIEEVYSGWEEKESWETDAEALAAISLAAITYDAPETPDTDAPAQTEEDVLLETEAEEAQTEDGGVIAPQTEAETTLAQTEAE